MLILMMKAITLFRRPSKDVLKEAEKILKKKNNAYECWFYYAFIGAARKVGQI